MFKKLFAALLFVAVSQFGAFADNQVSVKLGHMDSDALFMSMPDAKIIDSTIKKLTVQHEAEVKRMEEEYTRKLSEFKQGEATWDETIKRNRIEEIETLQVKMQNYVQTAQMTIRQKQEELFIPVREKVRKAIDEVGAENGFLYIFDIKAMLFKSDTAIDVTPLVKKKLGIK